MTTTPKPREIGPGNFQKSSKIRQSRLDTNGKTNDTTPRQTQGANDKTSKQGAER